MPGRRGGSGPEDLAGFSFGEDCPRQRRFVEPGLKARELVIARRVPYVEGSTLEWLMTRSADMSRGRQPEIRACPFCDTQLG